MKIFPCESYKTCPIAGKFDGGCDGKVSYNELSGYSSSVWGNTNKRIQCLYLENLTQNRRRTEILEGIEKRLEKMEKLNL